MHRRIETWLQPRLIFAAFAGLVLISQPRAARADGVPIDVAAGPAVARLHEFTEQTHMQVLFEPESLSGRQTHGVSGSFPPAQALELMLAGTGLVFHLINTRTAAITVAEQSAEHSPGGVKESARAQDESNLHDPNGQNRATAVGQRNPSVDRGQRWGGDYPDEVVVTGTHIRGLDTPVGSQLFTLNRQDIEKSAQSTVQGLLQSLPQNAVSGVRNDTVATQPSDPAALTNSSNDYATNLRGLGVGATLTLLNGRRLAPGGASGEFTGVSSIPLEAVERVEVLPDGASALYGSDAVGGVINIITRKDFQGMQTFARYDTVTSGGYRDMQLGQLLGEAWGSGHGMLFVSYDRRDPLQADSRARADSDLRRFGGSNFDTNQCNPGTVRDSNGTTYAIPAGQSGTALSPSSLVAGTQNLCGNFVGNDLLGKQSMWSSVGSMEQHPADGITIFVDASYVDRRVSNRFGQNTTALTVPDSNPYFVDPSGTGARSLSVLYNLAPDIGPNVAVTDTSNLNATLGAKFALARRWAVTAYAGYTRETEHQRQVTGVDPNLLAAALADSDARTAFNPFADGSHTNATTLAALRGSQTGAFSSKSDLWLANATVDGPAFALPGGETAVALGVDYRKQSFDSLLLEADRSVATPMVDVANSLGRHVTALFAEVIVPVFGDDNRLAGINRLALSFAGRYEKYSDFGSASVPKVGLSWVVTPGLTLRGTWGKSFQAPNLVDLDTSKNFTVIAPLPDGRGPGGVANVLEVAGGNSKLVAETARTWSAGIDLDADLMRGLRLSPTYFQIDFVNRITGPASADYLNDPADSLAVTRNPTSSQQTAACAAGTFNGNFGSSAGDCLAAAIDAIVDTRAHNLASLRESGIDLLASYKVSMSRGSIETALDATYLLSYLQQLTAAAPMLPLLNTAGNPIKVKLRWSGAWSSGGNVAAVFVNYAGRYSDTTSAPERSISSWTTVDASYSYRFAQSSGMFLRDTQVSFGVTNLLNASPPFYNNPLGVGFDPLNATILGRVVSLGIRKGL